MEKRKIVTGNNYWSFSGAVSNKSFRYSAEGNAFASLVLKVPSKNEKFSTTVIVKAFKETAEQLEEQIQNGQDWQFSGYLSKSSRVDDSGKKTYQDNFVVNKFEPAEKADFDKGEPVKATSVGEEKLPF